VIMNQLLFEGVRCFHDLHICPIKPITLLVGENSTGKTTFLALTRIAWDIIEGNLDKDLFNEEPFLLGSYDQVASFRGGRAGRNRAFTVGMQFGINLDSDQTVLFANNVKITSRFVQQGSESRLEEWLFKCGKFCLTARRSIEETHFDINIETQRGSQKLPNLLPNQVNVRLINELRSLFLKDSRDEENESEAQKNAIITLYEAIVLQSLYSQIYRSLGERPYAFAPIRTKPLRTYDPLKVVYDPEGSHVPMLLNRILSDESEDGNKLRKALSFFGETSGLFKKIEVKRKGDKNSDPFQIGVKTTGPSFNLIDVGYGVSQALPIIVDIILNPDNSTFLLQQPEVHLHPRAQAGLGSFLASTAKEQNKKFVIETHSDYLIDRIRMDVRDKKYLNPDDVAILYFEKSQGNVKIHELRLDEYGNIIDAPSTYRQFFLEEERRILGI
jgi:predicted ATPase